MNGYWLDDKGDMRIPAEILAPWIQSRAQSWVENSIEQEALSDLGIRAAICPSFMGNVDDYQITFQPSKRPKVYASVSGNDFKLYNWDLIEQLAGKYPEIEFHLYGNTKPWRTKRLNVVVHGRVPKEEMNAEIKHMQGGLRPLAFDGASEILIKSVLWGQWPISMIPYPHMLTIDQLGLLTRKRKPNLAGQRWYKKHLNRFPWKAI